MGLVIVYDAYSTIVAARYRASRRCGEGCSSQIGVYPQDCLSSLSLTLDADYVLPLQVHVFTLSRSHSIMGSCTVKMQ